MSHEKPHATSELRDLLHREARRLSLDPDSIDSPTPHAITAKTRDGYLLRLDVTTYKAAELAL